MKPMKCCFYSICVEGIMSQYRIDEIKYNIDTAIQKSMYETDEEKWDAILEVQSRLYEEFGIDG